MSNEQWTIVHISINTIAIMILFALKWRQMSKDEELREHVEVALRLMTQNARMVNDDKQRTIQAVESVKKEAKQASAIASDLIRETAQELKTEIPPKVVEEIQKATDPLSGVITPQSNKIPPRP